jgi:hypothetical protein
MEMTKIKIARRIKILAMENLRCVGKHVRIREVLNNINARAKMV